MATAGKLVDAMWNMIWKDAIDNAPMCDKCGSWKVLGIREYRHHPLFGRYSISAWECPVCEVKKPAKQEATA